MLVGTRSLWRRALDVDVNVAGVDADSESRPWSFQLMGSNIGAALTTLALILAGDAAVLYRFPDWFLAIDLPLLFVMSLPIGCFIWAFAAVLVSVDRIGQRTLELDPFPGDRTLGLEPIGSLVFGGFAVGATGAALFGLSQSPYLGEVLLVAAVVLLVAVALVLSMWRLHRQMVKAKKGYVDQARALYLAAYEPLRTDPSQETLEAQSRKLSAAESIEKRAESIHEWPIDDRTLARFAVVATGIITGVTLRVILTFAGL